jgi:hypothetical protein
MNLSGKVVALFLERSGRKKVTIFLRGEKIQRKGRKSVTLSKEER